MAEHSPSVTGSDESVLDGLASAYFHPPNTPSQPTSQPTNAGSSSGATPEPLPSSPEPAPVQPSVLQQVTEIARHGDPALVLPSSNALGPSTLVWPQVQVPCTHEG